MRIGDLVLENPFILAPIAGVTDAPFRRLCREQGASLVYSEMISAKGLLYENKNTEKFLSLYEDEKPVAYQIFGGEPDAVGAAAKLLSGRGNAVLDINMGCPVPKIVRNGEGSALLKNPDLVYRIVTAAVTEAKKPVTVKIRTGWDDDSVNAVEIAGIIESAGASAIAVHGRTRAQYYSGKADWSIIKDVKNRVSIPVIGNGDVFTADDAVKMLSETGCDFVMIARGAMGNPWIFRETVAVWRGREKPPGPSFDERKEMVCRHLNDLVAEKGEPAAVKEMRKHIGWYFKGIPNSSEIRRKVNTVIEADALLDLMKGLQV